VALTGDLSLLHDSNGFLCEPRPPCVFVVIDNSGGGIFSFLPQAEHAREEFERLFGTPHGRRLDELAEFHGLGYRSVETPAELDSGVREALGGADSSMIVVTSDRAANVAEHLRLARIVDEALAGVADPA
jgi:2-succinyl-5-enolpyruvyl-6-hydroxy-3-cyclohexene-1-carboxylate synthase